MMTLTRITVRSVRMAGISYAVTSVPKSITSSVTYQSLRSSPGMVLVTKGGNCITMLRCYIRNLPLNQNLMKTNIVFDIFQKYTFLNL